MENSKERRVALKKKKPFSTILGAFGTINPQVIPYVPTVPYNGTLADIPAAGVNAVNNVPNNAISLVNGALSDIQYIAQNGIVDYGKALYENTKNAVIENWNYIKTTPVQQQLSDAIAPLKTPQFWSNVGTALLGGYILDSVLGQGSGTQFKGTVKTVVKSVDDILEGATPGRVTKGRATQYGKTGGYNQALDDFNNMGISNVKDIPGGKVGKLPDGRTVNVRMKSSDGRPTLEIYDGKNSTKIRYDD